MILTKNDYYDAACNTLGYLQLALGSEYYNGLFMRNK